MKVIILGHFRESLFIEENYFRQTITVSVWSSWCISVLLLLLHSTTTCDAALIISLEPLASVITGHPSVFSLGIYQT